MHSNLLVEFRFWLLVFLSVVVPVWMCVIQRRKRRRPSFLLVLGLALIAISGADVWLLQALAVVSQATPSLLDDKFFNSGMSLALYLFPVGYGGIGINLISNGLSAHLMPVAAGSRDQGARNPLRPTPGTSLSIEAPPVAPLHQRMGAPINASISTEAPKALYAQVQALLDELRSGTGGARFPRQELFRPAFMVAYTRFETIDDMLNAAELGTRNGAGGKSWDAFVRSSTQFTGWDRMLESACRHWLATRLLAERSGHRWSRTRPAADSSLAALQAHDPPSYDWLAAMPRAPWQTRRAS